jgi:hypothetical protein
VAHLHPDRPDDRVVIRAAARRILCRPGTPADEVEENARALASLIVHGHLTLELDEGLDADGVAGSWLRARFDDGTETAFPAEELSLPRDIRALPVEASGSGPPI